jgi:lipid II:glycine glycyltransferase (peptidoglycan interpeptide bridge formation enzyme)
MEVKEIENKDIWEDFLLDCEEKTFLSSWNWGEFNKMMKNKIWRLGIFEGNSLISVTLAIKTVAKRGTFLLVPHGPNIKIQNPKSKIQILELLLDELKKLAKEERADFIRISPIWEGSKENAEIFKKLGFKKAPIHVHPEASWKLDIKPSEEELLMNMRKTTRYLIKQAKKNQDIEIFQSQKIEDIEIFDKLYQAVVKTQHFVPFSLEYLKNEFLAFNSDNQISLFFGKYKGEIIASAFVLFWSNIGFYHHAALLPKYHKIPIAYLLQWEAIKEAKKRGCNLYDFWGYVNPKENPKHPWAGPTLFKMGFGGKPYQYVKTQDFPLSKKYWLTYLVEKLRKTKRGL